MANGISVSKLRQEIKRQGLIFTAEAVEKAREDSICPPYSLNTGGLWLDVSSRNLYIGVPPETWGKIIQHIQAWKLPYIPDRRDCDDYMKRLEAAAWEFNVTGIAGVKDASGGHAYNLLLAATETGLEWMFFEPMEQYPRGIVRELGGSYQMKDGEISFG